MPTNRKSRLLSRLANKGRTAAILLLALTAPCACDTDTVYYHYESVDTQGWDGETSLHFDVAPDRDGGTYELGVEVRITADYPYKQLALTVTEQLNDSTRGAHNVLLNVTDDKGRRIGYGPSYYTLKQSLGTTTLQPDDTLRVDVRHNMRRLEMPGIADVGIVMKK